MPLRKEGTHRRGELERARIYSNDERPCLFPSSDYFFDVFQPRTSSRAALYKCRLLWCVQRVKSLHGLSLSPPGLKFKTSRKLSAYTCVCMCVCVWWSFKRNIRENEGQGDKGNAALGCNTTSSNISSNDRTSDEPDKNSFVQL